MADRVWDKAQLLSLLYECLEEVNLERLAEDRLAADPSSRLYGDGSTLDSMDLVRLVVLYEQKVNDVSGAGLSITNDRAMSEENSPFKTVGSLVDFVARLLEEEEADGG